MPKLIELTKNPNLLVSDTILNFDKPDKVYIPVLEGNKLYIKINDVVKIGTPLVKTTKGIITSPISGKISSLKVMTTINGPTNCLEITNDYEEKTTIDPKISQNPNNIKKNILEKLLKVHFNLEIKSKKHLILNCIDDEPYVFTENFYLFLNYEGFLELLDTLAKIYHYETITICVKSSHSANINKLMECLGMYPNIKLNIVPNLYLLGQKKILIEHLNYQEEETLVIKASLFYHIYNLIMRNRQMSDKLITINGNGLENPSIIKVKIGSKLSEIVKEFIKLKNKDLEYIASGLMTGEVLSNLEDFIVTLESDNLIIMTKKETKKEGKCLNCGACLNICPVSLNPILLKNEQYLKKVQNTCLKCGLCSYICPVYINFNKYLKGGNNEKNTHNA